MTPSTHHTPADGGWLAILSGVSSLMFPVLVSARMVTFETHSPAPAHSPAHTAAQRWACQVAGAE
jgi:hypothetical protein